MENNQTNEKQQDYELQAVPDSARKGFLPMFMIMMGFTFFSASMSVGGQLGIGLNMTKFIWALLIGNAILGVYTGILGYMGCKTGLTLDLMARHAFGKKGSWLCSAIITFTQMGWFGVGIAMFSIPVAELTGIPVVVLVILSGGLMTASAYFGIKSLEIVSWIAVPAVGILGCISVGLGVSSMGGLGGLFAAEPQNPITLATAITLVVGSFVSGGTTTPNYTRFCKNKKNRSYRNSYRVLYRKLPDVRIRCSRWFRNRTGRYFLYYDCTGISTSGYRCTWIKYLDHSR